MHFISLFEYYFPSPAGRWFCLLELLRADVVLWYCFWPAVAEWWLCRDLGNRCAGGIIPRLYFYSPSALLLQTVMRGLTYCGIEHRTYCWFVHFCRKANKLLFHLQWWTTPPALLYTLQYCDTTLLEMPGQLDKDDAAGWYLAFRRRHRCCWWTGWVRNIADGFYVYSIAAYWRIQRRIDYRVVIYRWWGWRLTCGRWCFRPDGACCAVWWWPIRGYNFLLVCLLDPFHF